MELSKESIMTAKPPKLPPRIGIHGVGGVGKTSIAAHFSSPFFILSPGETGLETLMSTNQLKPTARFPVCETWDDMLDQIEYLFKAEHKYHTLVLDTAPGFLRCLHAHKCKQDYNNDWGPKGFASYNDGQRECTPLWHQFLLNLDKLREKKSMTIILLMHSQIKNFKNPEGPDYDRYRPDMPNDDWDRTFAWLDTVLFMNFITDTNKAERGDRKNIAKASDKRAFYMQRAGAYDAKGGRYGLPSMLELPDNAEEAYKLFVQTMKDSGKEKKANGSNKAS